MYTCCPQCSTTFRVGPAQLQLADGKVRCGQCHIVFSALAYLREANGEPWAPPAQTPLPPIIAKADAAAESSEAGEYEGDLTSTDEWELVDGPDAQPLEEPPERENEGPYGLPDTSFDSVEEDELLDPQCGDASAAELEIEKALLAAMVEDETRSDREPEVEAHIEPSIPQPSTDTLEREATAAQGDDTIAPADYPEVSFETDELETEQEAEPIVAAGAEEELAVGPEVDVAPAEEWELGLLEAYAHEADDAEATPSHAESPTKAASPDQGLPDDDLDEFLFDDEHGIQEYLEQHKPDSPDAPQIEVEEPDDSRSEQGDFVEEKKPEAPGPTRVVEQHHATAAAGPVNVEPVVGAATPQEAVQVDDLSVFENFEHAVETAWQPNREELQAPAASVVHAQTQRQEKPKDNVDPAYSRAMMAQELGLLDADVAGNDGGSKPDAENETTDDELLFLVEDDAPAEDKRLDESAREVKIDVNPSQLSQRGARADEDPLDLPGSEEYTFPLYFEQEKASRTTGGVGPGVAEFGRDDQTELLVNEGQEISHDPDQTLMMRLPLGDSVEFEVPIDDEDDNTLLLDDGEEQFMSSENEDVDPWPDLPTAKGRPKKVRQRGRRLIWGASSVLLLLALATQLVHYNRESLVIHATVGPWLQSAYASLGLKLAPPGDLEQYEIRLHVAPAIQGTIQISATLANMADHVQPYPLVRLVLEDRWQEAVGNLIVEPGDYLAQATTDELMAPKQRVEAQIEVVDPGPTAESYKLDVCLRHSQGTLRCADDS